MTAVSASELRRQFMYAATLAVLLRTDLASVLDALAEAGCRLEGDHKNLPATCAQVLRPADGNGKRGKK